MNNIPTYAGGFLFNPNTKEVLLHKRDTKTTINPGKWAFFGGLCNQGESPKAAFIREMLEELSVDFQQEEVSFLRSYLNEELNTYRHVFYIKSVLQKLDFVLKEGADLDWIPLSEVFSFDLTKKTVDDLRYFIEG